MFNPEEARFLRLASGIWVATVVGIQFAIGLLTNEVKDKYQFTQGQLTTISTTAGVFGCFAFPAGFLWDTFGPKVILVSAGTMLVTGFTLLSLIFGDFIHGTVPIFSIVFAMIAMASAWCDIASLMTNLFNFPLNNGDVVILQKTFMGLGATIISSFYSGWFKDQYSQYCAFTAGLIGLIVVSGFFIIDLPPYVYRQRREVAAAKTAVDVNSKLLPESIPIDPKEVAQLQRDRREDELALNVCADPRRINLGFVLLAVLMIYLTTTQLITAYMDISSTCRAILAAISMVLIMSFLAMPFAGFKRTSDLMIAAGGSALQEEQKEASGPPAVTDVDLPRYVTSLQHSMLSPDIWLLWWYGFCVWGTGATIIGNSAQIYRSLNNGVYHTEVNAMYVAFIGLGSAVGRIVCGLLQQRFLAPRDLPLTWVHPVAPLTVAVGLVSFLILPPGAMLFGFTVFGFGFGYSWAATVLVVRRLFKTDVGKHYNFTFTAPMVSSVVLNRYVFGTLYDTEATKQGHSIHCSGVACVSVSMIVMTSACVTAAIGSFVVHWRWVRFLSRQSN